MSRSPVSVAIADRSLHSFPTRRSSDLGGGGGAEHVPEVRRCAHEHVFDGVGEGAASFGDPVGEYAEVLFEQDDVRSEEHTSELQSRRDLVCRLLLEKKKKMTQPGAVPF